MYSSHHVRRTVIVATAGALLFTGCSSNSDIHRAKAATSTSAHGLGANPQIYKSLLKHWAAAGFVVAAPQFPLTSSSISVATQLL